MSYIRSIGLGGCMLIAFLCQTMLAPAPESLSLAAVAQSSTAAANDFRFEVVSIRESPPKFGGTGETPDGYRTVMDLEWMIKLAYGEGVVSPLGDRTSVANLPNWATQRYQIDARVAEKDLKVWQNQGQDQKLLRSALRTILKERFHLKLHEQQVERDGYLLVVRKKGVTFKPTSPGSVLPPGMKYPDGGISQGFSRSDPNHRVHFYNASMLDLAIFLNTSSDRPIYDKTGLSGRYDFGINRSDDRPDDAAEEVNIWMIKDLGLELKPGKGPGINLTIDSVEKLTPN